ncbi:MAG TPA: DUF881 domain-containing protein [Nocardioides sp.]|nr:DUF881 domain-containing protein [Nocardioides sp.]
MADESREQERAPLPDRVTMPLLTLVTNEAVDEDYVHAAQRRAAAGTTPPASQRTRLRGVVAVTVTFGLLIALAAVQTARNSDVQQASRNALIDRIDERRKEVSGLGDRIKVLQRQNNDLQSTNSRVRGQLAEATVTQHSLQISTGFVAVSGPGLRITVSDAPDGSADGRVRASDLRLLVNGLWQAGAEAIAINGRRLSTISAIVNSNISVQVNRSPLTPPYVVSAIGDPGLASRLQSTSSGGQFQALTDEFGFVVDRHNESELDLPSAPDTQLQLRYAGQESGPPDNQEDAQ